MQSYSNHVYLHSYSRKNENLQWYRQTSVGVLRLKCVNFTSFYILHKLVQML